MNAVIAWQHYWNATNANESLREYVHSAEEFTHRAVFWHPCH